MMKYALSKQSVLLTMLLLALSACSRVNVDNPSVSMQGFAPFAAYALPGEAWQEIPQDPDTPQGFTKSFTVKQTDQLVKVLLVCPSTRDTVGHRVYYYLLTQKEMGTVSKVCRLPASFRRRVDVIGEVKGVDTVQKKMAEVTLVEGESVKAVEGFAKNVSVRTKVDFLAFMGSVVNTPVPNTIIAEKAYIKRADPNIETMFARNPTQVDFDFSDLDPENNENKLVSYIPSQSIMDFTVNLGSQIGSDVWHAQINFISRNGSVLKLAASEAVQQFQANTLPLHRYIQKNGATLSTGERYIFDDEGHELKVHVMKSGVSSYSTDNLEQDLDRMAVIFFRDSSVGQAVNITVPDRLSSNVSAQHIFSSVDNITQGLVVNVPTVNDSSYGNAKFIEVVAEGMAVPDPVEKKNLSLQWHFYITPQAYALTQGQLELPLEIGNLAGWKNQWLFGQSAVLVKLRSYLSAVEPQLVANYVFENKFPGNTALAMLSQQVDANQTLTKPAP